MSIKTKIDEVPVEFEIKSVGPATIEDIDKFKEDLNSGNIVIVKKVSNPYLQGEESEGVMTVEEPEVVQEVKPVEDSKGKPWWKSKTVIANTLTAIVCGVATYFTENPEMATYLPLSALAAINLVLRGMSKEPITIPFEEKIKPKKAD